MEAKHNGGAVVIRYEPHNFDRLYSPDGKQHLLPCEGDCGRAVWVSPVTDAVICETCYANPVVDEYDLPKGDK